MHSRFGSIVVHIGRHGGRPDTGRLRSGRCAGPGRRGADERRRARRPSGHRGAIRWSPEGEVDIVAWPGYIERGANDPTVDWVTAFEKETGCNVNVKDAATSDEMVQLINGGGYDLVTASGDASLRLVYGDSVQEIDTSRIPSYSNVDPRLQNAPGTRSMESTTVCRISGDRTC